MPEQLDGLRKAWRDRFGPFPKAVENLLLLTEIKLSSASRKISIVEIKEDKLMLTRNKDFVLIGGKFPRLTGKGAEEQLEQALAMIRSL
jgi:transcription-repair coupling factor (superfamily II helicase)